MEILSIYNVSFFSFFLARMCTSHWSFEQHEPIVIINHYWFCTSFIFSTYNYSVTSISIPCHQHLPMTLLWHWHLPQCHPVTRYLVVRKGHCRVLTYINALAWDTGLEASTLHRVRWKHTTDYSSCYYRYVQLNSNKWKEKLIKWSITVLSFF